MDQIRTGGFTDPVEEYVIQEIDKLIQYAPKSQTELVRVRDNVTVKSGKRIFVGSLHNMRTTDKVTGLVTDHSVLHPLMVRTVDNNKYRPHYGGGHKSETLIGTK